MNDLRLLLHADKERKIINLEFKQISNLQLMMPILAKFEQLESLSLNGNRLTSLPPDMSSIEKISQLDISNNLFRDVSEIVDSLRTLPRLTHLLYSFKNEAEEQYLRKELPTLERINKIPTQNVVSANKKSKTGTRTMKLNEKDLEEFARVYDEVREIYLKSKYFVERELAEQFDKSVDNIMSDLSNKLASSATEEEINASIVGCKYSLVDLSFIKLITYFYHFDKKIAGVLEKIHDHMADSFKSMNQILKESSDKSKSELAQVIVKKEDLYKAEIKRLRGIHENHLNEICALELKNAELIQKITKHGKNNLLELTIGGAFKKNNPKNQNRPEEDLSSAKIANKSLTLHQMRDCIAELYASKFKNNALCLESKQPMETLEAHMYTFLNQKYGLKALTVEWAMSIVNGIKKYGPEDAEVAAFGKILKNELEEEYSESLKELRLNIRLNVKKFKGHDESGVTLHEAQEVLLFCGMKRDIINLLMSRIKEEAITSNYLSTNALEQLALDYVFRKHEEQVRPLVVLFREVDTDDDGVISREQLQSLLAKLDTKKELNLDDLIDAIDSRDTNCITFSYLCEQMHKQPQLKSFFNP